MLILQVIIPATLSDVAVLQSGADQGILEFVVDGKAIPDVNFDLGQSFAGSLPVGAANNGSSMFFWFFPTTAENAPKEIVIWLNGGVSLFGHLVTFLYFEFRTTDGMTSPDAHL